MATRTTRTGSIALTAALVLTLAACASDGGSGASTGTPAAGAESSGGPLESGVLTVGTEGTYRPFTFHEEGSGDLTGYDVEVITAVAEELGVEVEFEETQWD